MPLQLAQGVNSLVSIQRAELAEVQIDVLGQFFKAAKLALTQPTVRIERDADKRWMYERWQVNQGKQGQAAPLLDTPTTAAAAPSWAVAIGEVALDMMNLRNNFLQMNTMRISHI